MTRPPARQMSDGTGVEDAAADSSARNVDLYGAIAAGQSAEAGVYDDPVVALIAF